MPILLLIVFIEDCFVSLHDFLFELEFCGEFVGLVEGLRAHQLCLLNIYRRVGVITGREINGGGGWRIGAARRCCGSRSDRKWPPAGFSRIIT